MKRELVEWIAAFALSAAFWAILFAAAWIAYPAK